MVRHSWHSLLLPPGLGCTPYSRNDSLAFQPLGWLSTELAGLGWGQQKVHQDLPWEGLRRKQWVPRAGRGKGRVVSWAGPCSSSAWGRASRSVAWQNGPVPTLAGGVTLRQRIGLDLGPLNSRTSSCPSVFPRETLLALPARSSGGRLEKAAGELEGDECVRLARWIHPSIHPSPSHTRLGLEEPPFLWSQAH